MSNARAIAAVTASLRALLTPAAAIVPGSQVTHLRPDAIAQNQQARGINIYLYMVRPNAHHLTEQLPARRHDGSLFHRVVQVLDLHYLLSFYGDDAQLEPHLLLGAASVALREQPAITPSVIRDAKTAHRDALEASDLAEQRPHVQIAQQSLSLEEMSKLWTTMIQTRYLLSTVCVCQGIFIEGQSAAPPTPPAGKPSIKATPHGPPPAKPGSPEK